MNSVSGETYSTAAANGALVASTRTSAANARADALELALGDEDVDVRVRRVRHRERGRAHGRELARPSIVDVDDLARASSARSVWRASSSSSSASCASASSTRARARAISCGARAVAQRGEPLLERLALERRALQVRLGLVELRLRQRARRR